MRQSAEQRLGERWTHATNTKKNGCTPEENTLRLEASIRAPDIQDMSDNGPDAMSPSHPSEHDKSILWGSSSRMWIGVRLVWLVVDEELNAEEPRRRVNSW